MTYGDDIIMSDGFEPDQEDEPDTADYAALFGPGSDDIDWDDESWRTANSDR
jgi:hypothetical protein